MCVHKTANAVLMLSDAIHLETHNDSLVTKLCDMQVTDGGRKAASIGNISQPYPEAKFVEATSDCV